MSKRHPIWLMEAQIKAQALALVTVGIVVEGVEHRAAAVAGVAVVVMAEVLLGQKVRFLPSIEDRH